MVGCPLDADSLNISYACPTRPVRGADRFPGSFCFHFSCNAERREGLSRKALGSSTLCGPAIGSTKSNSTVTALWRLAAGEVSTKGIILSSVLPLKMKQEKLLRHILEAV